MIPERLLFCSGQQPLISAQGLAFLSQAEDNLSLGGGTPSHFHRGSEAHRHRDKAKRGGVEGDPASGIFRPSTPDKALGGGPLWCL